MGQLLLLEVFDGFHDVEVNGVKEGAISNAALVNCTSAGSNSCFFKVEAEAPADLVYFQATFVSALVKIALTIIFFSTSSEVSVALVGKALLEIVVLLCVNEGNEEDGQDDNLHFIKLFISSTQIEPNL